LPVKSKRASRPQTRPRSQWEEGFTAGVLSALQVVQGVGDEVTYDEIFHSCTPIPELVASAKRDGNYHAASGLPQALARDKRRRRALNQHRKG